MNNCVSINLSNLDEICKLLELIQEKKNNLNCPISINKIKFVVKIHPTKEKKQNKTKPLGSEDFTGKPNI